MRRLACTALAVTAAACAAAPPQTMPSPFEAVVVVQQEPDPQEDAIPAGDPPWVDLARVPEARSNSAVERMTDLELVQWLAPELSGRIVATAKHRGMMPEVNGITLYEAPRPTRRPGLCEVVQHVFLLRTPDERNLTPQQQLDRPRQPYQSHTKRDFRVGGSTLKTYDASSHQGACWDQPPMDSYFKAPTTAAAWTAANLMEQAQAALRGPRAPGFRFTCTEFAPHAEGAFTGARMNCRDPRGAIAALAPHHLRFVRVVACEGTLAGPGACYDYDYRDPDAQESHSYWSVKIRASDRPLVVELAKGLYPPH